MVSSVRAPLVGRYQVVRELSASPNRLVLLAEDLQRGGHRCVVKAMRLEEPTFFEGAERVFHVLRKLRHPGIAEVYDFGRLDPEELSALGLRLEADRARSRPPRRPREPSWVPAAGRRRTDTEPAELLAYVVSTYYDGLGPREAYTRVVEARPPGGIESGPSPGWRVFLEGVARIFEALDAIHERGLIHYDLKDENILLIPDRPAGPPLRLSVKILDFDLSDAETTPVGTRVRGTVPFLAPELFERGSVDRRADLFSLGVTLATAVTGRVPFPGSSPGEWIEAARAGRRIDLRSACPEAPPGLVELIQGLLEPEPDKRPERARDAIPILERAGRFRLAATPSRPSRSFPKTGWERELGIIRAQIETMKRGEAERSLILVEGEPEQLADLFADEVDAIARVEGVLVEEGRARQPRKYAYEPFGEILCRLTRRLAGDATEPGEIERFLPVLARFCPRALPGGSGGSSPDDPGLPPLPGRPGRSRFLDLVTEYLLRLSRDVPIVVILRDLQWAGKETLELLRALARNIHLRNRRRDEIGSAEGAPSHRILLVGIVDRAGLADDDEPEPDRSLAYIDELSTDPFVVRLGLRNLALDEVPAWIKERVPSVRLDGEALRRLYDKSSGSVAFLDEFARRVAVDPATQVREDATGAGSVPNPAPDESPFSHVLLGLPRKAVDATLERIGHLSPADRECLEAVAAVGGVLAVGDLEAVRRPPPPGEASREPLLARLERLEELGLLRVRSVGDRVDVSLLQPLVGRQLTLQMREDRRAELHRGLARVLLRGLGEAERSRVPQDVAYHAAQGGLRALFVREALRAAERLEAAQAVEAAIALYEQILEQLGTPAEAAEPAIEAGGTTEDSELLRERVTEKLAGLYQEWGQPPKAVEKLTILSSFRETVSDPIRLASVYRRMAEAFHGTGELSNAMHFLEKSRGLLETAQRTDRGATAEGAAASRAQAELARTLMELARIYLGREHLEAAEKLLRLCERQAAVDPALLSRTLLALAEIAKKRGRHVESLESYRRALDAAREAGDPVLVLEVLRTYGTARLDLGEYDKALDCLREALEVARRIGSKLDMAVCYRQLGTVHHNQADHERALELFRESLALSSEIGDLKGIAQSYNNLGIVHRLKDDLKEAAECYRLAIDLFSRVNDQYGMAAGMNNLATILELEGRYDEALEYSFRALEKRKRTRSRSGMAFSYYGIGKIYQSKGELEKAASFAEKSRAIRREIGERLGAAYSTLLLSEVFLSLERYPEALKLARESLEDFQSLGNEIGTLLARANLGVAVLALGDVPRARAFLQDVVAKARAAGQPMLVGSGLRELGRIALEQNELQEADDCLAEGEKILRSGQSRKELAATLLVRASAFAELQDPGAAHAALEESYSILEDQGIRDLVPHYFLLRGRVELLSVAGDLESARNFLERGLVEIRETSLPELRARLQHQLGIVEERRGDPRMAEMHFREAQAALHDLFQSLAPELRGHFYRLREREAIRARPGAASQPAAQAAAPPEPPRPEAGASTPLEPADVAGDVLKLHQQTVKLHEVAAAMGSEPDLRKLLETVMDAVLELVDAERGFLILKGAEADGHNVSVARNLDREDVLAPEQKMSESVARQVLRTGKPMLVQNALGDERFVQSRSVRDLRLRSLVCVPLRFRGQTLGIIYLDNRHRRAAFSEHDRETLQAFADQSALAVVNARLIDENRRRNHQLQRANRKMARLNDKLRRQVEQKEAQLALARDDIRQCQNRLEDRYRPESIVGESEAMEEVLHVLEKVGATDLPVIIEGESGTGKDLVARAIHLAGPQRVGRFITENCATLTENLFETELFGHTRGAFTGAVSDKTGLLSLADGGTLFLDEIDDLSPVLQQKLLRALEQQEVRPVGSKESHRVRVRIIAASRTDLALRVSSGQFRNDLYYRLNGFRIRVPSLRERKDDIPLLVDYFAREACAKWGRELRRFDPAALRALMRHDWPGNVRELRHVVERTLLMVPDPVVGKESLVFDSALVPDPGALAKEGTRSLVPRGASSPPPWAADSGRGSPWSGIDSLQDARTLAERDFLRGVLEETGQNVSAAARRCRISRESLYRLLRKYELRPRR